ncbi:hypothetical protein M2160_007776 [Streptomyces sp. SAI-117]|uniref:HD domain-containing protein n=1 Tax=unclassified Streptomyces TaxID=2593676 RepID=UPI0024735BB6|nr:MULTISPECIES: HD domain-containing protein [unclassified Streptomyces]MDH6553676.1 hypothetical protein [Streptomyces sp. SAI-041]MDH6572755.1 hypothetical protein [Streptomyces sp. SAI-117]MDH6582283.1 hypothetical protein [Streptomyces sp. SAI-133]
MSAIRLAELDMVAPDDLLLDTAAPTLEQAVLAICPADRLHNLRTIAFLPPAKRRRKASETLEVFVPLARATGLTDVRSELEALAASVLQAEVTCLRSWQARARFAFHVLVAAPALSLTLRRPVGREHSW